jgi:putative transposase
MPSWSTMPAAGAWCATGSCRNARSRPGSGRSWSASPGCAIAVRRPPTPRFTSAILPRYLRRTRSLEELLPWLYLKGISSGDFAEALAALLGPSAPGLSAATISRLKEAWQGELAAWQGRDLAGKRYVYLWVDGVYFNARLDQARQCILVAIGADELGRKELVGFTDGYRESEQSWRELLVDLRHRGLEIGPELAIGDGNLGFWKALRQVYGATREQRCWVHKTANVLNKLPKGVQAKAKQHLHAIWMAETRAAAEAAFDHFVEAYGAKYKAVACLVRDRETLLAFYDFPAEHWKHVRTTNPVESTFATVRLRTTRTKGCLSRRTALTMVFRLCQSAQRRWRRLDGPARLAEVVRGVRFVDGEGHIQDAA